MKMIIFFQNSINDININYLITIRYLYFSLMLGYQTNMKCKNELVTLVLLNDVSLEFSLLATLLLLHISYNCTFSTLIEGFLRWSDPWWSEKKLKNFITNWWLEFKDKRPIHVITETYLFNVFLLTINTNNIAVDLTFTTSLRQPSKVGLKK